MFPNFVSLCMLHNVNYLLFSEARSLYSFPQHCFPCPHLLSDRCLELGKPFLSPTPPFSVVPSLPSARPCAHQLPSYSSQLQSRLGRECSCFLVASCPIPSELDTGTLYPRGYSVALWINIVPNFLKGTKYLGIILTRYIAPVDEGTSSWPGSKRAVVRTAFCLASTVLVRKYRGRSGEKVRGAIDSRKGGSLLGKLCTPSSFLFFISSLYTHDASALAVAGGFLPRFLLCWHAGCSVPRAPLYSFPFFYLTLALGR